MGFAKNFKSARIKNGLTQKQIAEKLNIDRSSIAHYESGDSVPSTKNMRYAEPVFWRIVSIKKQNLG